MNSLEGKVYAITGASRGMGLRFARAITSAGGHTALLARPSAALDEAATELPSALALPCDIGVSAQVALAFAEIQSRFGRLDGQINNAASCLVHGIEEASDDEIHVQVATNLLGPIYCIRAATPLLRARGGGDIINISSDSVSGLYPQLSLYAATKAGLETLSKALRKELRPHGIRVNVLRTGPVSGSSLNSHWNPERKAKFFETYAADAKIEKGPPVAPETIAQLVVQILQLPREAHLDFVEIRPF